MAGYKIKGQWKSDGATFFGKPFTMFEAMLGSSEKPTEINLVTTYLPKSLDGSGVPVAGLPDGTVELELAPGTLLVRKLPYTTVIGDPSKLGHVQELLVEDVQPEERSIKMLALPAS